MRFRSTRGSHVGSATKASSQISLTFSPSPNLSFVFSSDASLLTSFRPVPNPPSTTTTVASTHQQFAPFVVGMPHRKPLATLDPQSAHSRLTEDMSNSPSSSRFPADPKDAAANRYGRQILPRGSIGDEGVFVQSASSSRKNSLAQ